MNETDDEFADDVEETNSPSAKLIERLERERDDAQSMLDRIYHWIERHSQDGFIDSHSHITNLDRVMDCYYDAIDRSRLERDDARREADEAREQRDRLAEALEEIKGQSAAWATKIAAEALAAVKGGKP